MVCVLVYAQRDIDRGDLKFAVKELSIEKCNYTFATVAAATNSTLEVDEGR